MKSSLLSCRRRCRRATVRCCLNPTRTSPASSRRRTSFRRISNASRLKAGNSEFAAAEKQTRQALVEMQLPCLDYFMAHFLDSFRLTLDELE
ncbi:MAG: YfbR-like 5'-deoxynucleotidase [Acutalibacteraceae bacterium]